MTAKKEGSGKSDSRGKSFAESVRTSVRKKPPEEIVVEPTREEKRAVFAEVKLAQRLVSKGW